VLQAERGRASFADDCVARVEDGRDDDFAHGVAIGEQSHPVEQKSDRRFRGAAGAVVDLECDAEPMRGTIAA